MGEEPIAFVVAATGCELNPDDLLDAARTVLARFKVPKDVRVVPALPRNAIGTVIRPALREQLSGETPVT